MIIVIEYDAIGNPTMWGEYSDDWYNGAKLEWNGRELTCYTPFDNYDDGHGILGYPVYFTYNDEGIRTTKERDGVVHQYLLDGSQIVAETWTVGTVDYLLQYVYDETGLPIAIRYRTSQYAKDQFDAFFLEHNLQGDIVAIYNENGTKIGSYTYDAWGNFVVNVTTGNTTLENQIINTLNPFRYRSYYYDVETGLYYLQSRYYNPTWGRFISADGYVSTGQGVLGYNMFAYCNNNPVMLIDHTGEIPLAIFAVGHNSVLKDAITDLVEDLAEDKKNYSKTNSDVNTVYESNYFSSYKETLVIRHSISFLSSFAFGGVIFLKHGEIKDMNPDQKANILNHEYGHIKQEQDMGTGKYFVAVAIPSMILNLFSRKQGSWAQRNYNNMPWEYDADVRGDVNRGNYASWADWCSKFYMNLWEG